MIRQTPDQIVLASGSPRRRRLLAALGLSFTVASADIDEATMPGEAPASLVTRLSAAKARAVLAAYPHALIIAADTCVVLDGEILGKPANPLEAFEMLARLRDRRHEVYTGLALLDAPSGRLHKDVVRTAVYMRAYSEQEIARYVRTGDPLDKAGAYAIQHAGFDPVARIEGCYTNVVGLPLCRLYVALRAWGVSVPEAPPASCLDTSGICAWPREKVAPYA
ncbi:MAG: septum formation protein Maf [Chloroflexi bacterium]|nr:septum formation protein Maf [Chloroflexota bacterium]